VVEGFVSKVCASRDVDDFQVAAQATENIFQLKLGAAIRECHLLVGVGKKKEKSVAKESEMKTVLKVKLLSKMDKIRSRLEENKNRVVRVERLLEVATVLLS
jgi:hypothetical protein